MKQILTNRYIEFAAALDDAEDGGDLWYPPLTADMQPILPYPSGKASFRRVWKMITEGMSEYPFFQA